MEETPLGAPPRRWLWVAAIWTAVGLIDASQTVFTMRAQGMQHAWARLFAMLMLSWLPWALATPLVIRLAHRHPLFRAITFQGLCAHLGALAVISLVSAAWSTLLEVLMNPWAQAEGPGAFADLWLPKVYYGLLASLVVYTLILAITFVLESRERMARDAMEAARLGEQLSRAQLGALRRQMEPHFMFNTLNAISGLVRDNRNDDAVGMIAGLSEFLRRVADDSGRPQVTLAEEVEYLRRYVEIQKVRFAERLQVSVDIPAELLRAQVPNLILQPLVENAIKHGISKRVQGGAIEVAASRAVGVLTLSVYNDGPLLPANREATGPGIGLSNLRTRLQILHGTAFDLALRNRGAGGVEVVVSLPLKEGG
jgi:two-component system, LytTR family, sensor kinase